MSINAKDGWKYIEPTMYMNGMIFQENEHELLKFISYLLWSNQTFKEGNLNLFTSLPRKSLKRKFGDDYKKIINELERRDYIEVNNVYANSDTNSFSKSFRIGMMFRGNDIACIDHKKRSVQRFKDQSIIITPEQQYVHSCIKNLTVTQNPDTIDHVNGIRRALGIIATQHIDSGDVNLKKGAKSNRFFHTYLSMPKEYRKCCSYLGQPLVSVDIKSAHPTFCYSFYKHIPDSKVESEKYADIVINKDIYTYLNPKIKRDRVKKQMSQFLASEDILNSELSRNFKIEFPLLYDYIIKQDGLAITLQNIEAGIVCHRLVNLCQSYGYPIIPEHDGFSALPEHVDTIIEWLRFIIQDECGIYAVLKKS